MFIGNAIFCTQSRICYLHYIAGIHRRRRAATAASAGSMPGQHRVVAAASITNASGQCRIFEGMLAASKLGRFRSVAATSTAIMSGLHRTPRARGAVSCA